ncbi:hypothetical protein PAPYR_8339 [Paratrimastix pyriformis]|uniref:Man1/Src1-like C-terminal domain-containing protein n=1 Tax=Paratrimastix pyriformis TaxID=342808 RepID=A0ABQ8UGJ0_9EUKA|nr:hypothetical protein PAPYR_8339 [Paratrimastix pyriformis]
MKPAEGRKKVKEEPEEEEETKVDLEENEEENVRVEVEGEEEEEEEESSSSEEEPTPSAPKADKLTPPPHLRRQTTGAATITPDTKSSQQRTITTTASTRRRTTATAPYARPRPVLPVPAFMSPAMVAATATYATPVRPVTGEAPPSALNTPVVPASGAPPASMATSTTTATPTLQTTTSALFSTPIPPRPIAPPVASLPSEPARPHPVQHESPADEQWAGAPVSWLQADMPSMLQTSPPVSTMRSPQPTATLLTQLPPVFTPAPVVAPAPSPAQALPPRPHVSPILQPPSAPGLGGAPISFGIPPPAPLLPPSPPPPPPASPAPAPPSPPAPVPAAAPPAPPRAPFSRRIASVFPKTMWGRCAWGFVVASLVIALLASYSSACQRVCLVQAGIPAGTPKSSDHLAACLRLATTQLPPLCLPWREALHPARNWLESTVQNAWDQGKRRWAPVPYCPTKPTDTPISPCRPCPGNATCHLAGQWVPGVPRVRVRCDTGFVWRDGSCVGDARFEEARAFSRPSPDFDFRWTRQTIERFRQAILAFLQERRGRYDCEYPDTPNPFISEEELAMRVGETAGPADPKSIAAFRKALANLTSDGTVAHLALPAGTPAASFVAKGCPPPAGPSSQEELHFYQCTLGRPPMQCALRMWFVRRWTSLTGCAFGLLVTVALLLFLRARRLRARREKEQVALLADQAKQILHKHRLLHTRMPEHPSSVAVAHLRSMLFGGRKADPRVWNKVKNVILEDTRICETTALADGQQQVQWEWRGPVEDPAAYGGVVGIDQPRVLGGPTLSSYPAPLISPDAAAPLASIKTRAEAEQEELQRQLLQRIRQQPTSVFFGPDGQAHQHQY